jgi:hypothetical protein
MHTRSGGECWKLVAHPNSRKSWLQELLIHVIIEAWHKNIVLRIHERAKESHKVSHWLIKGTSVITAVEVPLSSFHAHRHAQHPSHAVRHARQLISNPLAIRNDNQACVLKPS